MVDPWRLSASQRKYLLRRYNVDVSDTRRDHHNPVWVIFAVLLWPTLSAGLLSERLEPVTAFVCWAVVGFLLVFQLIRSLFLLMAELGRTNVCAEVAWRELLRDQTGTPPSLPVRVFLLAGRAGPSLVMIYTDHALLAAAWLSMILASVPFSTWQARLARRELERIAAIYGQ